MRTWSPSSTRRSHEDNRDARGSSRYRYSPFIDLRWIEQMTKRESLRSPCSGSMTEEVQSPTRTNTHFEYIGVHAWRCAAQRKLIEVRKIEIAARPRRDYYHVGQIRCWVCALNYTTDRKVLRQPLTVDVFEFFDVSRNNLCYDKEKNFARMS